MRRRRDPRGAVEIELEVKGKEDVSDGVQQATRSRRGEEMPCEGARRMSQQRGRSGRDNEGDCGVPGRVRTELTRPRGKGLESGFVAGKQSSGTQCTNDSWILRVAARGRALECEGQQAGRAHSLEDRAIVASRGKRSPPTRLCRRRTSTILETHHPTL